MRLTVEVEGEGEVEGLPGEGAALVAFMSFAAVRGFGARHPLIALSERVADLGVRLGPLTTFYERGPEDAEDEANLERAWQDAEPLAASLGTLVAEAAALRPIAERAGRAKRRVRLTYEL